MGEEIMKGLSDLEHGERDAQEEHHQHDGDLEKRLLQASARAVNGVRLPEDATQAPAFHL